MTSEMTPERAYRLAQALKGRWAAETGLIGLLSTAAAQPDWATPIAESLQILADSYIDHQRNIDAILESS